MTTTGSGSLTITQMGVKLCSWDQNTPNPVLRAWMTTGLLATQLEDMDNLPQHTVIPCLRLRTLSTTVSISKWKRICVRFLLSISTHLCLISLRILGNKLVREPPTR